MKLLTKVLEAPKKLECVFFDRLERKKFRAVRNKISRPKLKVQKSEIARKQNFEARSLEAIKFSTHMESL